MRHWKINLAASWLAQFLCIAGFSASFPFMPFFLRDLGITDLRQVEIWAGLLASVPAISMAVVSPIWGILADRYGRKLMVERAAFGGAVLTSVMAFSINPGQLLVLRLLQGVFTGTIPAFITLVACFVPSSEAGFALGMMQVAVYAGSSVGPLIGGLVADHYGYRWAFGASGGLLLIAGIVILLVVQERFVRPVGMGTGRQVIRASARTMFKSLPVLGAMVTLFGLYMANSASGPLLPLLVEMLGEGSERINTATGSVLGLTAVASAISAAVVGRLSDRRGYRNLLLICSVGAILGYLGQALSPSLALLFAAAALTGLFTGGLLPTANAILARSIPAGQQGAVYGISNSINAAGRAIGPLMAASLATALGLRASFALTAVLFGLVVGWVVVMVRRTAGAEAVTLGVAGAVVCRPADEPGKAGPP
jgi:DHA1 family multidrug resistance protein-like MFS transporter